MKTRKPRESDAGRDAGDERKERLLERARKQFEEDESAEFELRREALIDQRFAAGYQWEQADYDERIANKRPAITHNRLRAFIQQVANEARQSKPQIRFSPVEDADRDTAQVLEGLARHIQYASDAAVAYETALKNAVTSSFGPFRLITSYDDPDNPFDQSLHVKAVHDPMSVYGVLIPTILGQKVRHAFVCEWMPRDEFEAQFPDSRTVGRSFFDGWSESMAGSWITESMVRVAEYWYIETERVPVAQLADGTWMPASDVPAGAVVVRTRTRSTDHVKVAKVNGAEVLEEAEWPGENIPVYMVTGETAVVGGKPECFSLIRFMRAAQILINFAKTKLAEILGSAPVSPFLVAEGQIEGYEDQWRNLNRKLTAFLTYRQTDVQGRPAPTPQRQVHEPPIAALSAFILQEIDELKAISGMYDASLGARSNETSGRAIRERRVQGQATNMHFLDNLAHAHERAGQEMAVVIPVYYDTARTVRILGEDETPKVERINQPYRDASGRERFHRLSAGKYDVVVTMGQSWPTRRMEAFGEISTLVQTNPQLLPLIGDIMFRNSDMAGGLEIAERFKQSLPPNLAGDGKDTQIPAAARAQLEQMGQMVEQLTAEANRLNDEAEKRKSELESRERIATIQSRARLIETALRLSSTEGLALLREEIALADRRLALLGADEPVDEGEQPLARQAHPGQAD